MADSDDPALNASVAGDLNELLAPNQKPSSTRPKSIAIVVSGAGLDRTIQVPRDGKPYSFAFLTGKSPLLATTINNSSNFAWIFLVSSDNKITFKRSSPGDSFKVSTSGDAVDISKWFIKMRHAAEGLIWS